MSYEIRRTGGKTLKLPALDPALEVINASAEDMPVENHLGKQIFVLKPGDKITATPVWEINIDRNIKVEKAVDFIPLNIIVGVDLGDKDQTRAALMDKDGKIVGLITNLEKPKAQDGTPAFLSEALNSGDGTYKP